MCSKTSQGARERPRGSPPRRGFRTASSRDHAKAVAFTRSPEVAQPVPFGRPPFRPSGVNEVPPLQTVQSFGPIFRALRTPARRWKEDSDRSPLASAVMPLPVGRSASSQA